MSVYPGLSILTLAVSDLPRARAFYERLGWRLSVALSSPEQAFFALNNVTLALRASYAPDPSPLTLTQCHGGPSSVDAALRSALTAGATLVASGHATTQGGYAARFADPDGYVWELASDPNLDLCHDGTLALPP